MMPIISRRIVLAALGLPAIALALLVAVQPGVAEDQVKVQVSGTRDGAAGNLLLQDKQLAHCLLLQAQNEVALATFATTRADSPEVKKFAENMVKDHAECIAKLTQIAGNPPGLRGDTTAEGRPAARRNADRANAKNAGVDLLDFQQELANQCLATTQRELGEKQGAEFDRCFIGQQIGAHLAMHDAVQVTMNHAGPELNQELTDANRKIEEHLAHAKKLAKGMEQQVAQRADDTEKK